MDKLDAYEEGKEFLEPIIEKYGKDVIAGKQVPPGFIVLNTNTKELDTVPLDPRDERTKHLSASRTAVAAHKIKADVVCSIMESWFVESSDLNDLNVMPSENPNRKEALFVSVETREKSAMRMLVINREGGVITLTDRGWDDNQISTGRFTSLLPPMEV